MQLYTSPLETVEPYNSFSDFCNTYDLSRGKNMDKDDEESSGVGEFKVRGVESGGKLALGLLVRLDAVPTKFKIGWLGYGS